MAFLALGGPVPGLLQQGRFKAIGYTGRFASPRVPQYTDDGREQGSSRTSSSTCGAR